MKRPFNAFLALLAMGSLRVWSAESSLSSNCVDSLNANSASVPMVSPPLEVVGNWDGLNCGGLDDPSPTDANLTMNASGVNVWYFDGLAQTGEGVEAVIGWQCVDIGRGYWWGLTPHSNVPWCNIFQVSQDGNGDITYINWSYGEEGVFAVALGLCPTNFSTDPDLQPLQASFRRVLPGDGSTTLAMTCTVPASSLEEQPACHSQFSGPPPNPFLDGSSLPAIDSATCKALPSGTSAATGVIGRVYWLVFASLGGVLLL